MTILLQVAVFGVFLMVFGLMLWVIKKYGPVDKPGDFSAAAVWRLALRRSRTSEGLVLVGAFLSMAGGIGLLVGIWTR